MQPDAEPATLAELIALTTTIDPDRTALVFEGRTYTYAQLDAEVERAANAFAHAGVRAGDRVALMFGNDPMFIAAFYGIARVGAAVVPINPMYRRTEIEHILRDSEPSAALVEGALWPEVADVFTESAISSIAVARTGATPANTTAPAIETGAQPAPAPSPADRYRAVDWDGLIRAAPERTTVAPAPGDLAAIVYTSGTTSRAKGAMHSHATLLANCRQAGRLERRYMRANDRALLVIPMCHIFGIQAGINGMFRVGGSIALMRRFDAARVLENVQRYRCTMLLGAPPMFTRWAAMPELATYDLSSLRIVSCGAAPLQASVLETFRVATGVSVSESYGLTEAGSTVHSNSAGPVDKLGSVGPVVTDVTCRLVDATGHDVAPGEPGEIILRSPSMMLGFWRNPQATAETIRDGWLHTGDVAVVDADGYYTIVDRLKDMISAGGFKIWPLEVETALLEHPAIDDVAVVGAPDHDAGEKPMAFIVRAQGMHVDAVEIRAFALKSLAKYKVPSRIAFVDALPRSSTGKVLRRELRERARTLVESTV